MACIVMIYTGMASIGMVYIVMTPLVTAYGVMTSVIMAYTAMAGSTSIRASSTLLSVVDVFLQSAGICAYRQRHSEDLRADANVHVHMNALVCLHARAHRGRRRRKCRTGSAEWWITDATRSTAKLPAPRAINPPSPSPSRCRARLAGALPR